MADDEQDQAASLRAFVVSSDGIIAKTALHMRHSLPSDCSTGSSDSLGVLRTVMVSAFGGGTLPGTLDEIMDGLYADTTEQMQLNAPIQYGSILNCGLCWVERMDSMVTAGKRFGFQLMKSVETEDRASDVSVRRINMSVCYLYCQAAPDKVDVFIRGIVELPWDTKPRRRQETINAAGDYILSTIPALNKRSKTERQILKYAE
ncbi:hypothetical protein PInf_030138 [Phytophthora infestans]|nr:hypothetical protein PInf_030138 [Phytophthora infestans]